MTMGISSYAQTITGIISDEEGNSLPGATVVVDGTTKGAFSDIDGKYTLANLEVGVNKIKFSFIGFTPQIKEVTLEEGETKTINVTLKSDAVLMDDVVVVGYGVQRKSEVTGSISTIDSKQIAEIPAPSFEAAIQGQAAGVQVSQGSGLAGSGSLIKVRGIASVSAGGDPLYVVDGIPITQDNFIRGNSGGMNNNPLASINPNDIESIEILKDAAATGIYGSRGANGVILITTKRAKKKGLSFDFTTRLGLSQPATLPDMMNSEEYLQMRQEAWENDGGTGYVWLPNYSSASDAPDFRKRAYEYAQGVNTDWVDQTIGTGVKQMYSIGAKKATDKYNAYASFSYDDNQSYLVGNSYERISGRLNADIKITKKLKAIISTSYARGTNDRVDAAWSGGLGEAMSTALPIYPVYWQDGLEDFGFINNNGYATWNDGYSNPVMFQDRKDWITRENRSISSLSLIYSPIENLNLKVTGGYDYMDIGENLRYPASIRPNRDVIDETYKNDAYVNNWTYNVTADYLYQPSEKHKFNFLIGNEYQRSSSETTSITINESPTDTEESIYSSSPVQQFSFLSYFGRANYVIDSKYIFQVTGRVDGSSRFGRNNRYGFFPAVSAGWILSEEDFLKESKTISYLKLRSSYGITGNANFGNYEYIGQYSNTDNGIFYNGEPIIYPLNAPNDDLKWETSATLDAALEVGLWQDRVTFELAYYNRRSKDVLLNVNLAPSTGFTNYWDNVGEVLNRGVEFSIKSRNLVRELQWTTDFNIARNYNELVDIGDYTPDAVSGGTNDSRVLVGKPIGSFYLVEWVGVDPDTGLPIYLDADGNETSDYDNANRRYVGDGLPDFVGGITNSFSFKNWDFSFLATYSYGGKIFDSSAKRQMGVVSDWNMRTDLFDRWVKPGDETTFPALTLDETNYGLPSGFPWWNTSLFVYDASYIRLRQTTLAYNFKDREVGKVKLNNMRLAFTVFNLFTLTDFPGLDPEVVRDFENQQDRNLSPNVTYLTPPQERSFNIQFSFSF
jgi:TonB-linked SusC/RagA family outer membrane protein